MKKSYIFLLVFAILLSLNTYGALTDNLESYYKMDNTTGNIYDELGRSNMNQVGTVGSGNGKILTSRGSYTTSNYFSRNNHWQLNGNTNFSVSLWVNDSGASTNGGAIILGDNSAGNRYFWLHLWGASDRLYMQDDSTDRSLNIGALPTNTWIHIVFTYNATDDKARIYINNILNGTSSAFTGITSTQTFTNIGAKATGNNIDGYVDEVGFWNKTLSVSEISQLYNSGSGLTYPFTPPPNASINISFFSQSPAIITSTTLFSQNVNIAYNVTNLTSVNSTNLFYKINHNNNCYEYLNGTCTFLNNTFYNTTQTTNTTQIYNWSLDENVLYHSVKYLNNNYYNQTHNTVTLNNANNLYKSKVINFSLQDSLNYYEVMAKSTGITGVYYCNSSYTTGNPATSSLCAQIYSGIINFNHSHNAFSNHSLITFSQNSTGFIGNIKATATSYFIFKGSVGNTVTIYTIPNSTNTSNYFSTSINNGVTYTDNSLIETLDSHIHQFSQNDTFIYKGCLTKGAIFECTSETSQNIILTSFSPVGVQILIPNASTYQQYINISYIISEHPNNPVINNSYINISLYNSSGYIKHLKTNDLNTSYYWNTYDYNLTVGMNYYLQFNITDTYNQTTSTVSDNFNVSHNAYINVSAFNQANASVSNFTIEATDLNTSQVINYSTTTGSLFVNTIRGNIYALKIDALGYAFAYHNHTINQTYDNYNFSLEITNGVGINIYSETNGSALVGTLVTVYTSLNTTLINTNTTNTSQISFYNLEVGNYTFRFEATNFAVKEYYVEVGNRSFQNLNVFMLQTASSTIFTFLDENNGNTIPDVTLIIKRYINGTLQVISSLTSDITGRVQFNYQPSTPYYFTASNVEYTTKEFVLNPVIFSSYNVKLTPTVTQTYEGDYSGVQITYNPNSLNNNQINTINFVLGSPEGRLTSYGFNVTYKGNTSQAIGNNAYGGVITANINITGATFQDTALIQYFYTTSSGATNTYAFNMAINSPSTGNYTIFSNRGQTYGLGDFERIMIITVILILVVGAGTMFSGPFVGAVMGMFVLGFFAYMQFISWWATYPTLLFLFIYGVWGSSK